MTVKLLCLGSRPHGRQPVYIEEIRRLVHPNEMIDGRDNTWATQISEKYNGCFRVCVVAEEKAAVKQQREKVIANAKDK